MNHLMHVAFLAMCTLLVAAQTVAFSPGYSSPKVDVLTGLNYRNFYDILTDMSTGKTASAPKKTPRKQYKSSKRGNKSVTPVTPPRLYDEATFTTLDVDADRMPLSILLAPPTPPLTKQAGEQ